ncbi:hypothetical protein [Marinitoga lauensis]|uniref:hypothetical protein n=1 Tax=Marinitoga lauensis TaxID=2201189 RepID=UPI00101057B3|nr:hypothetical protein [Marinitoga lauensis]
MKPNVHKIEVKAFSVPVEKLNDLNTKFEKLKESSNEIKKLLNKPVVPWVKIIVFSALSGVPTIVIQYVSSEPKWISIWIVYIALFLVNLFIGIYNSHPNLVNKITNENSRMLGYIDLLAKDMEYYLKNAQAELSSDRG